MSTATIKKANQYLTFKLAEEEYAVDVSRVREVLELTSITKIPQTQKFMRGVINLRGAVVPVIDLRSKFGMAEVEKTIDTCIVVMEVLINEGEVVVLGALTDSVQEVIDLEQDQIEPTPKIGSIVDEDFIKGMGKREEQFIIILDIDKIFTSSDLENIQLSVNTEHIENQNEIGEE